MRAWEDAAPGNRSEAAAALTTLARVPRHLRWVKVKLWYRRSLGPPRALTELQFIYFARTALLEGFGPTPYIYFESDFNGSFDAYIDAFSYVVPKDMRQIWAQAEGFPGPKPASAFKHYIRRHDFAAAHYYASYAGATVTDVLRALQFRRGFVRLRADVNHVTPEAFADRWHHLWSEPVTSPKQGLSVRAALLLRDTNLARGDRTYGLTVLRPIRCGEVDALCRALRGLQPSPFAAVPRTHFARLVVLDRYPFEGQPQLLFSTVFDGDRDRHLRGLCDWIPQVVDGIWGHCDGAPTHTEPAAFARWLREGQQRTTTFFAPYGHAGAERVQEALTLFDDARECAVAWQYATPRELLHHFQTTWP